MLTNLIKEFCETASISGYEDLMREKIHSLIKDKCEEVFIDNLGNIIAKKSGKKRAKNKVLFSAHMDEVGFLVTHIDDDGLVCFSCVGGIQAGVIAGRRVVIGEQNICGIIGAKPVHMLENDEKEKPCAKDDMRIDIGADSKQEAEKLIALGDMVTFDVPFEKLGTNKYLSKAIDDRVGCALLCNMIESELEYDCMFSFTVQEETGCAGAKAVAYNLKPDIAVAVEATTAADLPDICEKKQVCVQGKGAVVSFMDRGTIYTKDLYHKTLKWAQDANILCQTKQGVYGGNESRNLQTAGGGAKTLAVSLPTRYIHAGGSVVDKRDIQSTQQLLLLLNKKLCEE